MTGLEIVYLLAALAGVGLVVGLLRRAAFKQVEQAPGRVELEAPGKGEAEAPPKADSDAPSAADGDAPGAGADDRDDSDDDAPDDDSDAAASSREDDSKRLREGLAKTRGGFVARLGKIFGKKKIDADLLDELEEVLLTADIGPKTADKMFQAIKGELSKNELADPDAVWDKLRRRSSEILAVSEGQVDFSAHKPFVLLTVGVNGVGKTTTIGKLAAMHVAAGKKVLLAAGDTFRAAAVEQLEVWGERAGAPVVKGKSGADPSSVIFNAIERGVKEGYDLVICDTAGRLHTKVDLMEELKKVHRVCDKALAGAPHETWLVVDATTGQNAISQAQMFGEATNVTGIVLTKLDGTAKGGVILGIADELAVPVRFIGIGEQVEDLRPFDADQFVEALFGTEQEASAA